MKALILVPIALFAIAGCSSAPKGEPAAPAPAPAAATTEPATAKTEPAATDSGKTPAATTVAMAKCDMCGAEAPSADLTDLHGQMACKACAASHTH